MTFEEIKNRLVYEMIQLTGHFEDHNVYATYIQRALCIGMEHFIPDQNEIIAFNQEGVIVARYKSVTEASQKLGVSRQAINKVLVGKNHTAKNLIFRKAKEVTS